MNDQVMVGVASIPERVGSLEKVVKSLSAQADRVSVSLNGYKTVPPFFSQYRNVEATLRPDPNGGDAEKFAAVDDWYGFYLSCDDDILYPRDYVKTLVEGIKKYGLGTVCGFHGGTTLGWNGSAVAASHKRIQCLGNLQHDDPEVNVLGTGVLGFHTEHVPLWRGIFRYGNMADVQMACHAHQFGIPFVALAHKAGWLRDICPPLNQSPRIHESNKHKDKSIRDTHLLRAQEIRRFDWLSPKPAKPTVRVSIATCQRPEKLTELLEDLRREQQYVDLEICVYEDQNRADYRRVMAPDIRWHRFHTRLGKMQHWRLVNQELHDAKASNAAWFLFLPDDVRLVRHAIPKAITTWGLLDDPTTLTLWRLKSLEDNSNWTGVKPVQRQHATEIFHVDGLYICKREALECLNFEIPNTKPTGLTGSRVGAYISKKLHRAGKRMYRVDNSLAINNDGGKSIMNGTERKKHPTVTL